MQRFVGFAQRVILARKNPWLAAGLVVAGVAVGTFFRFIIDRGASGFLFSGYLPIILLAAMLCGWRIALFSVGASLAAVWLVLLPPSWIVSEGLGPPAILLLFLVTMSLTLVMTELLRAMIFRYEAQANDFAKLNAELIHRNKNALQVLMAMIQRGLREQDMRSYFEALPARMGAWAQASELLRFGTRSNCEIGELVNLAIGPFNRGRFRIDGPQVLISEKGATALSLILHELGTNATKYGALSADSGIVSLVWMVTEGVVQIRWEERLGPPVQQPTRRGFGSMLLRPQADLETVEIEYALSGVVATVRMRALA